MSNLKIGNNIKEFRKNASLTQQELADAIGKTESTIRKYENESIETPLSVLNQIAGILNVEIWDLIGSDCETASQSKGTLDELGDLLADDERDKYEFQKEVYEQEDKEMADYYYTAIVPLLKTLGYKSNFFTTGGEHTIILNNNGKELEVSYKDVKEAVKDSLYLADHLVKKHAGKVKKSTRERLDALHNSSTKEVNTYNDPDKPAVE